MCDGAGLCEYPDLAEWKAQTKTMTEKKKILEKDLTSQEGIIHSWELH